MRNFLAKTSWIKIVEVVRTVVEIIAIVVAGWWGYTRFVQEDTPSLVQRADILGNVSWYSNSIDDCQADLMIDFQNIGKVPIEVGRVRISAWRLSESDGFAGPDEVKFLNPLEMRSGPPVLEYEITDRIVGTYAPNERSKNVFSFLVNRSIEQRVLFKIDMWRKEDDQQGSAPYWYSYHWSWPCDEYPKTLTTKRKVSNESKEKSQ